MRWRTHIDEGGGFYRSHDGGECGHDAGLASALRLRGWELPAVSFPDARCAR